MEGCDNVLELPALLSFSKKLSEWQDAPKPSDTAQWRDRQAGDRREDYLYANTI